MIPLELLWGKADPAIGPEPHPVALHMLDVAAVAHELIDGALPQALTDDLLSPCGGMSVTAKEVAFIVACHDLGKLTPGFQAKVPTLRARIELTGADFPADAETNHAYATAMLGPSLLGDAGIDLETARYTIAVVAAHHGAFQKLFGPTLARHFGGPLWQEVRTRCVASLRHAIGAVPDRFTDVPSERWLMAMAGLTVLADWIGSNTEYFPYEPGATATAAYYTAARGKARRALEWLGLARPVFSPSAVDFSALFPGFAPNAMQRVVLDRVSALERPGLLVVEARTGGGKTEAAFWAALAMNARFSLGGIYVALPTQATSNQMFGRLHALLEGGVALRGDRINLQLLHATRDLQPDYLALRQAAFRARSIDGAARTGASVVAESWFHGRKRGLLAPFAVGTVDQALMGALQVRHYVLRLLGLARKVLIVDEVHAYDTFMAKILDRLLDWLAVLGSGVVLLSATLPKARLASLLRTWQRATRARAEAPEARELVLPAFPRVLTCDGAIGTAAIPRAPEDEQVFGIRWIQGDLEAVAAHLVEATRAGGCAAWIHNTVKEAQTAYLWLRRAGVAREELVLFHARFPQEERMERERLVLERLGKSAERPHRLIVVATQVIEQSLDLDFDFMVSALAPIDLLIQRAGRLHRHRHRDAQRPPATQARVLHVWRQAQHAAAGADEVGVLDFGPSGFVYDRHVLLRTELCLRQRAAITLPGDADTIMQEVYPEALEGIDVPPEHLDASWREAWRRSARALVAALARSEARANVHLVPVARSPEEGESFLDTHQQALDDPEERPDRHEDFLARTRDIGPTVTLVCLARRGDEVVISARSGEAITLADEPSPERIARLAARSLTVQHRGIVRAVLATAVPPGWVKAPLLRHARAVVFDGQAPSAVGDYELRLDPELGLVIGDLDEREREDDT